MKKRIKTIMLALIVLCANFSAMPIMAAQQNMMHIEENDIQPRTDIKEWKYAVINGNLYKRLYNYTRNRWETDWILVAYGE